MNRPVGLPAGAARLGAEGAAGEGVRAEPDQPDQPDQADHDPYLWLEDLGGPAVRAWVAARSAETTAALCDDQFERDRAALLAIFDAPDRIPWISRRGRFVYNFWRDA